MHAHQKLQYNCPNIPKKRGFVLVHDLISEFFSQYASIYKILDMHGHVVLHKFLQADEGEGCFPFANEPPIGTKAGGLLIRSVRHAPRQKP